jgi:hypothetical protein
MMRSTKNLLIFFLVMAFTVSCVDNEEVSFALQDISAPTNLNAVFDISQDDTGTVTITPTAVGASSFDVFFGDVESETATAVSPGETRSKVYGEGEFNLRIVAVGTTGLTSELVRVVTISFSEPTDLLANITISTINPFEISVAPIATNATVFDVFYGDVDNEEATTIMTGETATHLYAETGDYIVKIVARGAGAATAETEQTITILGATDPVELPINFDSSSINYVFGGFEGADSALEANPDINGINTTATVLRTTKTEGAQFFAGTTITVNTPIDFSVSQVIEMQSYSPKANIPVRFRIENEDNSVGFEVDANTTLTNEWELLSFDFSAFDFSSSQFVKIVIFYEFVPDLQGDGSTYYFDTIQNSVPMDNEGDEVSDNVDDSGASEVAFPLGFESTTLTYNLGGFEGADSAVEANPFAMGINPTGTVVRSTKNEGAQFFAGTALTLDAPIDFSESNSIGVKVYSPKSGIPIKLRLENEDNSVGIEVDMNTTTLNEWEELVYDFSDLDISAQFVRLIIFFEFIPDTPGDGSTYYFDDIQIYSPSSGTGGNTGSGNVDDSGANEVALPLGFESTALTYSLGGFEGADSAVEANPFAMGINPTGTVVRSTKNEGAQFFAGTALTLDAPIDFSESNSIGVKVYSPKSGIPIKLRLENEDNSVGIEVDMNTTTLNEWEELVYDFSNVDTSAEFVRVIVFFEFIPGLPGDGSTYYFDDIQIIN